VNQASIVRAPFGQVALWPEPEPRSERGVQWGVPGNNGM
jgi:hypothetical protein